MERRKPKKDSNDNPFSFRNFLTTAPTNTDSSFNHAHLTNQPENTNNNVFGNRRRDPSDRVANPYSFARFIQNPDPARPVQCVRTDNCMIVQGELPDFVQDHFSSSNGLNPDHNQKNGLPDFTLHTTVDNNSSSSLPFYNHRSDFNLTSSSSSEELLNATPNNELPRLAGSNSANLPDFLSDTGINIATKDNDLQLSSINNSLSTSNSHLHNGTGSDPGDESTILSARISELEEELSLKCTRIRQLEQQLTEQKRKEAEETEIMESMMRQVDENLEKAVERWQNSERDVERLNGRVRQLEIQLSRASSEGAHAPMHLVRHIGAQLGSDLIAADEIMKRFLEQSDKMKLLAGHLQFLDRVEDISQSDQERSHPL